MFDCYLNEPSYIVRLFSFIYTHSVDFKQLPTLEQNRHTNWHSISSFLRPSLTSCTCQKTRIRSSHSWPTLWSTLRRFYGTTRRTMVPRSGPAHSCSPPSRAISIRGRRGARTPSTCCVSLSSSRWTMRVFIIGAASSIT